MKAILENKNILAASAAKTLIAVFFAFSVVFPVCSMLLRMDSESMRSVFSSGVFASAAINSLVSSSAATAISVVLAFFSACFVERVDIKFKRCLSFLLLVPMLIPSISHSFGLIALFGTGGFFTRMLGMKWTVYGYPGIIAGGVLYSFPVCFLMFSNTLKYENPTPYRAAEILGVPLWRRFAGLTLPYMKKTIISCCFMCFTMVITDYGVPLMIGGKVMTLSVLMYNKAVAQIDYGSGSIIGCALLLPAIAAFVVDMLNPSASGTSFVNEKFKVDDRSGLKIAAHAVLWTIAVLLVLPVLSFAFMAFSTKYPVDMHPTLHHVIKTLSRGAGGFFVNSIGYALGASLFGTAMSFVCAYVSARMKGKMAKALHLMFMVSMAVPGVVLGLSYVIFFSKTAIYGTVTIIIIANSLHFFSSPYLMAYNSMLKMNPNLESVGYTLGVSRWRIIKDVVVPKLKHPMLEGFSYYFVNSMMTISAVSFLAPPSPKPLSLMINQFEAQRLMESAAFVSLVIFAANVILKAVIGLACGGMRKECD